MNALDELITACELQQALIKTLIESLYKTHCLPIELGKYAKKIDKHLENTRRVDIPLFPHPIKHN